MSAKTERVQRDIDKTKGKIAELQASLRELERRKTELENTEIVDFVRGMDISLADLAAMLKGMKGGPATSGHVDPKPEPGPMPEAPTDTEQEDSDNE